MDNSGLPKITTPPEKEKNSSTMIKGTKLFKLLGIKEKPVETVKKTLEEGTQRLLDALDPNVAVDTLPQEFHVKFLGSRPTRGLWGIQHTRGVVEELITESRNAEHGMELPCVQLRVFRTGVSMVTSDPNSEIEETFQQIDSISYGVQDVKYSRVFSMIIVDKGQSGPTFQCFAYVCSSRIIARRLAYALALAFKQFGSECVKNMNFNSLPNKFAIDLRQAEDFDETFTQEQESEV